MFRSLIRFIVVAFIAAFALTAATGSASAATPTLTGSSSSIGTTTSVEASTAAVESVSLMQGGDGPQPPPPNYLYSNTFYDTATDFRSARVKCIEQGNEVVFNDVASDYYCWLTAPGIAELWLLP